MDYRERKLQEFFPREPISSYARLQEGLRLVHVKSDNLDDSGESVVDTVPKVVVSPSRFSFRALHSIRL